jgi:hypothetical protein
VVDIDLDHAPGGLALVRHISRNHGDMNILITSEGNDGTQRRSEADLSQSPTPSALISAMQLLLRKGEELQSSDQRGSDVTQWNRHPRGPNSFCRDARGQLHRVGEASWLAHSQVWPSAAVVLGGVCQTNRISVSGVGYSAADAISCPSRPQPWRLLLVASSRPAPHSSAHPREPGRSGWRGGSLNALLPAAAWERTKGLKRGERAYSPLSRTSATRRAQSIRA